MKKSIILLVVISLLSFLLMGCTKDKVEGPGNEIESLTGYSYRR